MTVSELIRTKRAVRQFTDVPISEEAVRSIATTVLKPGQNEEYLERLIANHDVVTSRATGDWWVHR